MLIYKELNMKIKLRLALIIFLSSLTMVSIFAQPANDLCTGAITVTPDGTCVNGTTVGANDNLGGAVGCQSGGSANSHEDVWYSFTSTGTTLTGTVTASGTWTQGVEVMIFSGGCGGLSLVNSQCGASPLTLNIAGLTNGTTYFIVVSNQGNGNNGPFSLCPLTSAPASGCAGGSTGPTCGTPLFVPTTIGVQTCVGGCNVGNPNGPDFAGATCYDFLSPTSWFSVNTGTAGTLTATVTSTDLTAPHMAFFYTTDCATFTQLGCATGSGGTVNLTDIGVPAGATVLVAVNDAGGLQGAFNICLTLNPDNSVCNIGDVLAETGSSNPATPVGGPYSTGEVVSYCYTINQYQKVNCNWLQGIVPNFGNCWDPASFNAQGMPVVTTALVVAGNESGTWSWYPAGAVIYNNIIGSLPPLTPLPPGWFFQCNTCGVSNPDPDLSWGDGGASGAPSNDCAILGNGYTWTVCFNLIAGPPANCTNSTTDCSVSIKTYADGEIGGWDNVGCTGDQAQNFFASFSCCTAPTITPIANQTICNGTAFNVALTSNQDPGVTYTWTVVQGLNITGGSSGSGATINQTLTNSGTTLSSATYTVVANNGSCSSTTTFTISVVPTVNASISAPQTVINCTFPSVTLTASSTSNSPTYLWSTAETTAAISVSSPGTYTVTVTSTAGCTATATVTITQDLTTPIASAGPDQMLTCLVSSVVLDGSGSTGSGVTYSWVGPGFTSSLQSPTVTVAGTYTITVTNTTSGCTASDIAVVTADPAVPVASAGADQFITCLVSSVNLDGSGSSTGVNFTYSWAGPGAYSSTFQSPTGLTTPGIYTLTVTNTTNSCTAIDQAEIILDNPPPTASAGSSPTITCTTPIVTLDGSGSASGAFITYSWTGPGAFSSSLQSPTTSTIGSYTVLVTNTNTGCTNTSSVTVNIDNIPPVADAGIDDTLTCIVLSSILGGPGTTTGAGINYVWLGPGSFGSVLQNPTVSTLGTYTFTVTNSVNGCSATDSVNIVQNNTPPIADAGPFATLTCANDTVSLDGSLSDNGPGYSIQWNGPSGYTSTALSPNNISVNGTYTITITNTSNGCTATNSIAVLLDNSPPTVDAGPNLSLDCATPADTLTGSSFNSVTYSWTTSNGNIVSGAGFFNPIVDAAGTYVLVVTDANNGCTATDSATVTLSGTAPNANAGNDTIYPCNTGSIIITGSSSTSNISYAWTTIGGSIVSGGTTVSPSVGSAGQYIIIVTDTTNSCTQTDTMNIVNAPAITLSPGSQTNVTCFADNNGTANTITTGGTAPIAYAWLASGGTSSSASNLSGGVYTITVTDNYNCSDTTVMTIIEPTLLILTLTDTVSPGCGSATGSITVLAAGGSPLYTYGWVNSGVTNPTNANIAAGNYTSYVTDNNGCMDSLDIVLDCEAPALVIPQLISPNGDGQNDVWYIQNLIYYPENNVKIFNRWGNEVFNANPYNNDWGGVSNISFAIGTGILPTGTYFYVIDLYGNGSEIITNYIEIQK